LPYVKQTWVDGPSGGTPLSAARMNYVETGIQTAQSTAESAAGSVVGAAGTVPVSNGTIDVYTQLQSQNVGITTFELTAGGAYTFALTDLGKLKGTLTTDTAGVNFTIPPNSSVAFPLGATIKVLQRGTGQITTVAGTGVIFVYSGAGPRSSQQGGTLLYTKLFTDTWLVEGGVA
jgi:hypothetical protein